MEGIITLAHGAGGTQTNQLIEKIFHQRFQNPYFTSDDAAVLESGGGRLAFTTDGFIVSPPFFPGGDIGKLSVCGTVNDLACMGARPVYLSCSFIIEEGFLISDLEKIADSMANTAREAGVSIVAGDTKVAGRGQAEGVFITTSGIGFAGPYRLGGALAEEGDAVLVTGDIGRHGSAILCARGDYGIQTDIRSDCAPLSGLAARMLGACGGIHVIRDATRGGVGTVLYEIAAQSGVCIWVDEETIPVAPEVSGLCGMLGLEPLYMACEGRMVVVVPERDAGRVLNAIKDGDYGENAAVIGRVTRNSADQPGTVVIETPIGGQRLLARPGGELLPRIC
ncbi:MAG TPA: hydrogenase expression/formation protein HypE [Clostridia bacterium]|nr:hydrogenase expression/formation protein HypE [Clostridia bacterium]